VLYDACFITGHAFWPLWVIGLGGGLLGFAASLAILTRTRDSGAAKQGALLCGLAVLFVLPLSLPVAG
jgi:hypothetical protein